jgi:hypothetical protein
MISGKQERHPTRNIAGCGEVGNAMPKLSPLQRAPVLDERDFDRPDNTAPPETLSPNPSQRGEICADPSRLDQLPI